MSVFVIEDFGKKSDWLLGKTENSSLAQIAEAQRNTIEDEPHSWGWIKRFSSAVHQQKQLIIACDIYNDTSLPMDLSQIEQWPHTTTDSKYDYWKKRFRVTDQYALAISALLGIGPPRDDPGKEQELRNEAFGEWFETSWTSWTNDSCDKFVAEYEQALINGTLQFPKRVTDFFQINLPVSEAAGPAATDSHSTGPEGEQPAGRRPVPHQSEPQNEVSEKIPDQPQAGAAQTGPDHDAREKSSRLKWLISAAVAGILLAGGSTYVISARSAAPPLLKPADNWAECVPGGGPVTVTTSGGAVPAEFSCPPDGWLALPSPGRADEAIRTVEQSDPDLTLTPEELTYGNQVKRVYRPQRSVTELAFAPRDVVLRFACGNGADIVEISRGGAAPRVLRCSTTERHFNIPAPKDARVDLVFRSLVGAAPKDCQAVFAHVDTIDLTYPAVCTASTTDSIARPPLRPFVAELDTRTDPHTGLVWMRDLFRYGNAGQIEPDKADNSLAVILAAVSRDTGQDGWRVASDVEAQSAARSIFLPQGPAATERLRGIVADPDCSNGGFAKLDMSARQDAPLAGTGFELARPCNLNAPEFGLWLVREP